MYFARAANNVGMTLPMKIIINIRPSFPPMIACDHRDCKWEWFHYSCVGVKKAPKGRWFCKDCKTL